MKITYSSQSCPALSQRDHNADRRAGLPVSRAPAPHTTGSSSDGAPRGHMVGALIISRGLAPCHIPPSSLRNPWAEAGYKVLTPYGDSTRYDLVIEDADGQFWRVQCKTGWVDSDGAYIQFKTASSYYHTKAGRTNHGRRDYRGQIDYFAVYCPDMKNVYLVPVDHVEAASANLRLLPTANKQEKNVRWAQDYEL